MEEGLEDVYIYSFLVFRWTWEKLEFHDLNLKGFGGILEVRSVFWSF